MKESAYSRWMKLLILSSILYADRQAGANAPLTLSSTAGANAGAVERWDLSIYPNGAIPYLVNSAHPASANPVAPPGTSASDLVSIVRSGFQIWQDVPSSKIRYEYQGTTARTNGLDGFNVVTFSPQGFNFPPGFPGGIFPLITAALAAGPVVLPDGRRVNASFAGQIFECDIVINPQGNFSIAESVPAQGQFDLLGILVHEIGHFSGLDHSGVGNAVMYGFFTLGQGFFNRAPKEDDITGISWLYPTEDFLRDTGGITGSVSGPGGASVFGAQVVAVDAASGAIAATAVTGVTGTAGDGGPAVFGSSSGRYVLMGLPPGAYTIFAEPLDGPTVPFMSGVFGTGSGGASFIRTDFHPSAPSSPVIVGAGALVNHDIGVTAKSADSPNLGASIFSAASGQSFVSPALVQTGTSYTVSIGGSQNLVSGNSLVSGASFSLSGTGISIGTPTVNAGFIFFPLNISANAATGPRLLSVSAPNGLSVLTGGVAVMPPSTTFAQFANGQDNASTTILINPSPTITATGRVELRDDEGNPMKTGMERFSAVSEAQTGEQGFSQEEPVQRTSFDFVVAPFGSATIRSDGQGGLVSGSATLSPNHTVGGIVKFRIGGLGIAGVEQSRSLTGFITPVRRIGNINTGIAIRNVTKRELTLTLVLRSRQGTPVTGGNVMRTLKADGHVALFITQLFPGADLTNFVGTLTATASAAGLIAATALELGSNAGEFTALPVTEIQDAAGTRTLRFAQFANGDGVRSDLVITNASTNAQLTGRVEFFDDSGNPLTTGIEGFGQRSSLDFNVPPLGSVTFNSDGLGTLVSGSARVMADRGAGGVIRFTLPGLGIAGVGTSEALDIGFIIPIRTSKAEGSDTGVALVNAGDAPIDLLLTLRDSSGIARPNGRIDLQNFPGRGHLARFARQLFPDVNLDDFDGTLSVLIQTAGGRIAGTALELGSRAGQFTTLPVVPLGVRP